MKDIAAYFIANFVSEQCITRNDQILLKKIEIFFLSYSSNIKELLNIKFTMLLHLLLMNIKKVICLK